MIVYGLVGFLASGKGTVGKMIAEAENIPLYTYGNILRAELVRQGKPATRENLQRLVTGWRQEKGNDVLAKKVIEGITGSAVVDGFRSPDEVRAFRKTFGGGFKLIFVDAPIEVRFERAKKRNRAGGPGSFEEFKAAEEKEAHNEAFGIAECIKSADVRLDNSGSVEELKEKISGLLACTG